MYLKVQVISLVRPPPSLGGGGHHLICGCSLTLKMISFKHLCSSMSNKIGLRISVNMFSYLQTKKMKNYKKPDIDVRAKKR